MTGLPVPPLLPLGLAQQEVLQDQRAWPGSPHLLVGGCGVLEGPADADLLRAALADLIAEQPVLRMVPGLAGQRLLDSLEPPLLLLPAPRGLEPLDALQAVWRDWTRAAPPLGASGGSIASGFATGSCRRSRAASCLPQGKGMLWSFS